jgi:hypothetical protein
VPAGTVRWRLKEGLARLRRRLDDQAGGRRASVLALAWLAGRRPLAAGAGLTAASFALVGLALLVARPPRAPLHGLSTIEGNQAA